MWDPDNTPLYYQCLRDIATTRKSEALVQKASLLESQGYLAQSEISQAYDYFNITLEAQSTYRDEQILDLYRSRVLDLGKDEQERAKQALSTIAQARRSELLKNATSDSKSHHKHIIENCHQFEIEVEMHGT